METDISHMYRTLK